MLRIPLGADFTTLLHSSWSWLLSGHHTILFLENLAAQLKVKVCCVGGGGTAAPLLIHIALYMSTVLQFYVVLSLIQRNPFPVKLRENIDVKIHI